MNCPFCQHPNNQVIDTRPSLYNHIPGIRRRRTCLQCKKRFSSFEMSIHDLESVEPATLDGILEQIVKIFKEAPTTNYKTPPSPIKVQTINGNGKTLVAPSKALTSKDIKEAMQRARRQYIEELDDLDASEFDDEDFD